MAFPTSKVVSFILSIAFMALLLCLTEQAAAAPSPITLIYIGTLAAGATIIVTWFWS